MGDFVQRSAGGNKLPALSVREADAQRRSAAAAAIVGGAAAQSQQNAGIAPLYRVADKLAHAVGCGDAGVLAVIGQRKARAGRHFDHGLLFLQLEVGRLHALPKGALHPDCHQFAAADLLEAGHGAFATVRHRDAHQLARREHILKALPGDLTDLAAGKGPLERVRDHNALSHGLTD